MPGGQERVLIEDRLPELDFSWESEYKGLIGLGEIGIVGVQAAIANAVYHATGRRIRSLPITIDQLPARGA
jgi:CO/xanthine dehydrogenase Mo-binding subunit